MQIKQAFTYKYENKHFGKNLKHAEAKQGQCFENVKNFCKTYQEHGRNVRVSVVLGMRTWDDGATCCYHYLVKDVDTQEFTDPQYSRYTFIELHSWTLEEYEKECVEFEEKEGVHPAQEFAYYYIEKFKRQLLAALKFIKSQGYCKVSDKELKGIVAHGPEGDMIEPTYGKSEIACLNIG